MELYAPQSTNTSSESLCLRSSSIDYDKWIGMREKF